MTRVVILIISTEKTEYERQAKLMWRRYMNKTPEITCMFIENDEGMDEQIRYEPEKNLLKVKDKESLVPGIFIKTIRAFKWILSHESLKDCNYIVRTNLSSFWIFDRLLKKLPRIVPPNYVLAEKIFDYFPSGCGMVLSKQVVESLCTINYHKNVVNNCPDDVLIGKGLEFLGITTYNDGAFHHDLQSLPPKHHYHIRCKLGHEFQGITTEMRRQTEIPYIQTLIQTYYYTFQIYPKYFDKQILIVGDFQRSDIKQVEKEKGCHVTYISRFEMLKPVNIHPHCIIANTDAAAFPMLADYALGKGSELQFYIKNASQFGIIPQMSKFMVYHQNSIIDDLESYLGSNDSCILRFIPDMRLD